MKEYETLLFEVRDSVGLLTLNRPERINAINDKMIEDLEKFWRIQQNNPDVRVIIINGAGEKGFCAGIDLKEIFPKVVESDIKLIYGAQVRIARLILAMRQAPQPIIGAIHGAAVGGGLSFALGSCIRVISDDTRFAASYINNGMGGADCGSSYLLPRIIGAGRAYEFLLTGDFMNAETALGLGMVSRVVTQERELLDEAFDIASRMCRKNPLGLRLTKEAINCNLDAAGLEQALNVEDRNQALCMSTIRYEGHPVDTR